MCIFSQQVHHVGGTSIFARRRGPATQVLVYEMRVGAAVDLAMVLPLPVPPRPAEDAVRFIDLERYPLFFEDMRGAFGEESVLDAAPITAPSSNPLAVQQVGAFEASFVPTIADFARLDPRFTLPGGV